MRLENPSELPNFLREKSEILQATDLLRIFLGTLNLEEITAHLNSVYRTLDALGAAYGKPGFSSQPARISASHLEQRLQRHLADVIALREMLQVEAAAGLDQQEEIDEAESLASGVPKTRRRRKNW